MCGRYVLSHPSRQLQQWYEADDVPEIPARFDIAPGNAVQVVRRTSARPEVVLMRWGFIPSWADDAASVPMLHNARGETVAEKPMFRQSFRQRRCLIPATGFYEWQSASGQKLKHRYYLSPRDGNPLSFAAVWDSTSALAGATVETCAIVTTKANSLIEPIHHRMPVLLDKEDWALWLDAETPPAALLALLRPYPSEHMLMWEVADPSDRTHDDDPALLTPLAESSGASGGTSGGSSGIRTALL